MDSSNVFNAFFQAPILVTPVLEVIPVVEVIPVIEVIPVLLTPVFEVPVIPLMHVPDFTGLNEEARLRTLQIGHGAEHALSSAQELGHNTVDSAQTFGHNAFNSAQTLGHNAVNTVETFGHNAYNTAENLGHNAINTVENLGHNALNTVQQFGHNALDTVEGFGHNALNTVQGLGHSVLDTAEGALSSLGHLVESLPVIGGVATGVHQLYGEWRGDTEETDTHDESVVQTTFGTGPNGERSVDITTTEVHSGTIGGWTHTETTQTESHWYSGATEAVSTVVGVVFDAAVHNEL